MHLELPFGVRPHLSLLSPVWERGDYADVSFGDGIFAGLNAGQKRKGFLDVRGEEEQRDVLGHPGASGVPESRRSTQLTTTPWRTSPSKRTAKCHQLRNTGQPGRHVGIPWRP